MIQYFETKEKKHLDDLLFHLRAHNKSFTGEKVSEQNYIYVLKNDVLLGGCKSVLSWDWVGLNDVFYENIEVLKALVAKACSLYKEKTVGLKLITKDESKHKDFLELGFLDQGSVTTSPKRGTHYFSDIEELTFTDFRGFHTISSKDIINEYDIIMKKKSEEYKRKFHEMDAVEELLYVAYDEDIFVGGIQLELYEDSLYVDLLAVNKDYRGKDIGTKLMNYAEQVAENKKMVSIDLGTTAFQARPFYEKLGYKVVFTRQNFPKGFECYTLIKQLKEKQE